MINHYEYKGRIKFYEEINIKTKVAHFHGCGVTSILGGKTVGVAPDVNIYYIAYYSSDLIEGSYVYDLSYIASAIDRILEINQ